MKTFRLSLVFSLAIILFLIHIALAQTWAPPNLLNPLAPINLSPPLIVNGKTGPALTIFTNVPQIQVTWDTGMSFRSILGGPELCRYDSNDSNGWNIITGMTIYGGGSGGSISTWEPAVVGGKVPNVVPNVDGNYWFCAETQGTLSGGGNPGYFYTNGNSPGAGPFTIIVQ